MVPLNSLTFSRSHVQRSLEFRHALSSSLCASKDGHAPPPNHRNPQQQNLHFAPLQFVQFISLSVAVRFGVMGCLFVAI